MNSDGLREIILEEAHYEGFPAEDLGQKREELFEAPQTLMVERAEEGVNRFYLHHHAEHRGYVSILLTGASGEVLFQREKACKKGDNQLMVRLDQEAGEYTLYLLFEEKVKSSRIEVL